MTKTTTYIVIGVICLLFFSCNKKDNTYQGKVLSVELKENELDPSHLFSKVEIIPLETTDESLITSIHQIIEYNNRFYKSGKFLYKIDKTGDGPEEYNLISETIINQNKIYMLSPMGFIHVYDIEGNFVDKYQLPSGGGHDMIKLENDIIAYWTLLGNPLEYKVTFYNLINKQVVGGFWKDNDDTFMSNMCIEVFYNYDNNYYFSTQFSNEVYRFNTDTIELEYKWDFGHNNLNLKPYIKDVKKDLNNFSKLTDTMEIPYYFFRNFQNKNYYYTILKSWPIDKWRNIFYRKKDGKSYVFDTLKGGVKVKDVSILTDTYMISVISPEEIQSCKEIISNEDLKKYNKLKDDSNLCLFKLYFK